jgi:glycosyltransferase involved in cell wall biosynthesis
VKISIITVSYNSAATIEDTIQSVLSQTHTDLEYIVVDGNSSDGTKNIIEKYRSKIAHYISEADTGIYDAMNKGIALATGDVVGILNSDDVYKNTQILSKVSEAFQADADCICTDVEIFKGTPAKVIRYYSCTKWKPWMFRLGHQPPHPGFFVRKECYKKHGIFNTKFKLAADFDILLRFIYKARCKTLFLPWVSVSMRSGGASQKSFQNIQRANNEVNQALRAQGYFSLPLLIWLKYPLKVFQFGRS